LGGAQLFELVFDFLVFWKPTQGSLGENQPAVDDHIKLTALACLDLYVLVEPGLQDRGQTGRARLIASSAAIEDFGSHGRIVSPTHRPLKRLFSTRSLNRLARWPRR
jgi:hypothetical protein